MFSNLRGALRLTLFLGLTLATIPIQSMCLKFGWRWQSRYPIFHHRMVCRLFGIELDVRGDMSNTHPTLFVANHASYIDIEILGSLIEGSFIAKAEIADWPFFGLLAKLQRSIFVERRGPRVREQREMLLDRLRSGDNLILFPEGTSNDGNRTLPFKSSLFAIADFETANGRLAVQPVSIAYTHLDGIPLGRHLRPFFAWYGDMDLVPHLWSLVRLGRLTARVQFHPPVTLDDFPSRKEMADYCQRVVAGGVSSALAGRPVRQLALPAAA